MPRTACLNVGIFVSNKNDSIIIWSHSNYVCVWCGTHCFFVSFLCFCFYVVFFLLLLFVINVIIVRVWVLVGVNSGFVYWGFLFVFLFGFGFNRVFNRESVRVYYKYISWQCMYRKEGNVLINNALSTFYLWLYGILHMVKDHLAKEETCCLHIGYSFCFAARILLYAPSHRQDSTYHSFCYTSLGALAGTRNSSMGPLMNLRTMSQSCSTGVVEGRKEMFYLTTHSAHFIYGYMAFDIWKRTTWQKRKPASAT